MILVVFVALPVKVMLMVMVLLCVLSAVMMLVVVLLAGFGSDCRYDVGFVMIAV